MAQPYSAEPAIRTKKSAGAVVLLTLMTLSNVLVLVLGVSAWADAIDHGDEDLMLPAALTVIVSVVAIVALGGAWFTRLWGPRVYVVLAGAGLILGIIVSHAFSPLSLVSVGLAVALWLIAESNW
jgi:hypothetical protein